MPLPSVSASPSVVVVVVVLGAFAAGVALGVSAVGVTRLRRRRRRDDAAVSPEERAARARLWRIVGESFTGALIVTGDELDLYEILHDAGPVTPAALANDTGWSERWLLEWLSQMTAAGICAYREQTNEFRLKTEYAKLLRDPDKSRDSLVGLFAMSNALQTRTGATAQAIKTGIGVDYDFGEDVITAMDRKNRNYFEYKFFDEILDGTRIPSTGRSLVESLEEGIAVADIGCGCGASTIAMARRFPKSRFHAYEISPRSLALLKRRVTAMGLDDGNIRVCDVSDTSVADGPDDREQFDFVYTHDVLHDMPYPRELIRQVRRSLSATGCWIIVDVKCGKNTAENLRIPSALISMGSSCLLCLASATSLCDGEGLGTLGFHKELARKWMNEAGFHHCIPFAIPSLPDNQGFLVG